jgi:protein-S-isoprenylcysteine O-methyltransferase Ste14
MKTKTVPSQVKDHPGVYVPPPLLYVAVFFLSILMQRFIPLDKTVFQSPEAKLIGWVLIVSSAVFVLPALWRFFASKNSLVPIKPANTLQTTGIYAISRNPMYLALLLLYLGFAIFKGNWWTYILSPLVVVIIQSYVIRKEEQYLHRTFHHQFETYCKKVRRWI